MKTAKWQPIESAPRDGTLILVARINQAHPEDEQHIVRWDDDWWQVHCGKNDHPLRGDEPTHWMPRLPMPKVTKHSHEER